MPFARHAPGLLPQDLPQLRGSHARGKLPQVLANAWPCCHWDRIVDSRKLHLDGLLLPLLTHWERSTNIERTILMDLCGLAKGSGYVSYCFLIWDRVCVFFNCFFILFQSMKVTSSGWFRHYWNTWQKAFIQTFQCQRSTETVTKLYSLPSGLVVPCHAFFFWNCTSLNHKHKQFCMDTLRTMYINVQTTCCMSQHHLRGSNPPSWLHKKHVIMSWRKTTPPKALHPCDSKYLRRRSRGIP